MTQRTPSQNKALHVGFQLVSKALNDAGLDIRATLKPHVEIPWTPLAVKEYLFRPVMTLSVQKESTTELEKVGEIEKVWDIMMRYLGENHGLEYIPFPSDAQKVEEALAGYKLAAHEARQDEYPEDPEDIAVRGF